ncbi:hypothetical protein CTA1_5743 [Colletotrichum tanaceti]|uniref:Uncharacterized protein n=1 Tax=Colletotrichum tanaceti TaxID=1306861 RepID=A0A4U6X048_9PEZI|nr:hypothetical protein CTA1_5743 [Colletotrichum tanaceti]
MPNLPLFDSLVSVPALSAGLDDDDVDDDDDDDDDNDDDYDVVVIALGNPRITDTIGIIPTAPDKVKGSSSRSPLDAPPEAEEQGTARTPYSF